MNHSLRFSFLLSWWLILPLGLLLSLTNTQAQTWTGWETQRSAPTTEFTSITYGNGLYVAVANKGLNAFYVYTSTDGRNWTSGPFQLGETSIAAQSGWQTMAFGANQFLALRNDRYEPAMRGYSREAWRSDAVGSASATSKNWTALTYGGGQFVGISAQGLIMTTPGGTPFNVGFAFKYYNTTPNGWSSIAYGNGMYVAVASSGNTGQVMTSPDGITWTARTAAAPNAWTSVTYGNGVFVAVASSGTGNRVMTSPDGITWTARMAAADNDWSEVTFGGGQFVAVATSGVGNRVMTSPDGITWTARSASADNDWVSVTYGDGQYVAVAAYGSYERFMTSPDGITWSGTQGNYSSTWTGVTYGRGKFLAVDSYLGQAMTSPDGVTWTTHKAPNVGDKVAYGNGMFVSVGKGPSILDNGVVTSPDGITWTQRSSPMTDLLGVAYGNGQFVAVGERGVMTSPDGVNWTVRDDERGLIAVVFGEGLYVAIATNGTVITSPDGITWTKRKGATQESGQVWRSIAWGNSRFVAVASVQGGGAKLVLTSPDGINWTAHTQPTSSWKWQSVTYGSELFVAVCVESGEPYITYSMTSPDGVNWTARPTASNGWSSVTYARGLFVAVARETYGAGRTMVMTSGCLRPLVSITANPSLTITQGQSTTLTASGAHTYQWASGQITPTRSVSAAGVYSLTGTSSQGCSQVASVTVTVNPLLPDLIPVLYARPTGLYGNSPVSVVVDVVEINGVASSGLITLRITQDSKLNLSLPPTATSIGGRGVTNSVWSLSGPTGGYYVLTSSQSIPGGEKLSVGLTGDFRAGASDGIMTVSGVLTAGSGGDGKAANNLDADKVEYFQQ